NLVVHNEWRRNVPLGRMVGTRTIGTFHASAWSAIAFLEMFPTAWEIYRGKACAGDCDGRFAGPSRRSQGRGSTEGQGAAPGSLEMHPGGAGRPKDARREGEGGKH